MANTDFCVNCFKSKKGYDVCPSCGWYDGATLTNAYHLYPGSILRERYLIGMSIGFGGFGITYKAWDSKLGTVVAIKEFYPSGLVNRVPHEKNVVVYSGDREIQFHEQKKRFLEEARTMSKFINHPNIVHVFDFFEENNTAYIVMEYLDGISVKKFLEQCGGKLDEPTAVDIMIPILDALTAIHAKKIVHRDISPDNIFLTLDNKIKLLDLGAARLTNSEKEETISVVIKPGYAPPEQYRSKSKQGPWTDIYGVGATLYKFLTGETPEESIDRSVKDTLKKPSALGVSVDSKLDRIVMKAMALKPELRFQSAQQMKNALLQQKEVDFPEDELRKRKTLRTVLIAAVSALSLILITTVALYFTVLKPEPSLATLDIAPGTISVTLPTENQADFDKIIEQFNQKYEKEGYKVSATYVDKETLATISPSDMPTLMATDNVDADFLAENFISLDLLLNSVEKKEYVFAKQYDKLYPGALEIPLGFDVLLTYVNTSAAGAANVTVPDALNASDASSLFGEKMIVDSDAYTHFLQAFDTNALTKEENGMVVSAKSREVLAKVQEMYVKAGYKDGAFIVEPQETETPEGVAAEVPAAEAGTPVQNLADGKCYVLVDDTASYHAVQENLAGYYKIIPLYTDENEVVGQYNMHLGVSKHASENEQNIAQLFLAYCLSDESQNILHIQGSCGLPVHVSTLETFTTAITNELAFINTAPKELLGADRRLYESYNDDIEALLFDTALPEAPITLQ